MAGEPSECEKERLCSEAEAPKQDGHHSDTEAGGQGLGPSGLDGSGPSAQRPWFLEDPVLVYYCKDLLGLPRRAKALRLVGLGIVLILLFMYLTDDSSRSFLGFGTGSRLIDAPALCADGDLFNPSSRMCKMESRIAFAAMALMPWAHCALQSEGAKILQSKMDETGSFWYNYRDRSKVSSFYKTCFPSCANARDEFDVQSGLCRVKSKEVDEWLKTCYHQFPDEITDTCVVLQLAGVTCKGGSLGIQRLLSRIDDKPASPAAPSTDASGTQASTPRAGGFVYKPELGSKIEEFYASCHPLCAESDRVREIQPSSASEGNGFPSHSSARNRFKCFVVNKEALNSLTGSKSSCTNFPPIGIVEEDGEWVYPTDVRDMVNAFYDGCRAGDR